MAIKFRRGGATRAIRAAQASDLSKWRRGSPLSAVGTQLAPNWVSPTTGSSVTASTPFVWKSVPRATASHFSLQADSQSSFATATEYRSDRGGFEYWNGSAWTSIPTAGMPSGSSGNSVRFTPTLPSGSSYIRVRQSK